jgi:hypothetical protein
MSRELRSDAQIVLDVMFIALSRTHAGEAPKDREECMEWARRGLRQAGLDVEPMGLCHAVIKQPVLCRDNPDWDWWLKLPEGHRGAVVKHYREILKEFGYGR